MALTKISGEIIQTPLNVGVVTANSIGIGTTNPSGAFQVGTATTQSVIITSTGILGVGGTNTGSSSNKFQIITQGAPAEGLGIFGTWTSQGAEQGAINFYGANNASGALANIVNIDNRPTNVASRSGSLVFKTASGGSLFEALRIDSSQRVGIGTTNPAQKLQVYDGSLNVYKPTGEVQVQVESGDTSVAVFRAISPYRNWRFGIQGGANADFVIRDATSSANRLGITSAGEVIIGSNATPLVPTGTASQTLQVTGGGYFSSSVGINTVSPIGNLQVNATTSSFVVTGVGSVGIGLTNPRFKLEVGAVGASGTSLYVNGDARVTGILSVGQGTITINGNADKITAPKFEYAGISSTITATAVDVFVYDTRKDSDGGAWRKRTQYTSWYNETLNTATRGSRREFPAVAVIVVTTNTITIYDGDDPDMPIWMKFTDGFNTYLGMGIGGLTSVAMLNGVMVHGGQYDVHVTNFISDKTNRYGDSGITVNHTQPISGRNNDTAGNYNGPTTPVIANRQVNDVAMTVLPNAPIDSTTGLPVPTIAVATQGGLSIIKDDGTVISATSTSGGAYSYVKTLTITDERYLWFLADNFDSYNTLRDSYALSLDALPSSNFTWDNATDNLTAGLYYAVTTANEGGEIKIGPVNTWSWSKQERNALGGPSGLAIHKPNIGAETNSLVVGITSTYNTGWMHGNIKGAFLSDTSTTSVTGTELVTNGDFSTSTLTSYGQLYNCSLSVVSNQLRVTSTAASGYAEFYVGISDTTKYHYFSFQFVGASGITQFGIYAGSTGYITDTNAGWTNSSYTASRSAGIYTLLIPPGNSIVGFVFALNSLGQTWTFDNISLKPVQELDRSVNNRGLAVYGTITKTAVATGADLVAYSGFSLSNYLVQPYNSVLVAGTGSQCFMGWVYTAGLDTNLRYLFSVGRQDSNEQFRLGFSSSAAYFDYGNGSQYIQWSGNKIPSNSWTFVVAMITAGQSGRVFINGIELTSPSYNVVAPSTFSTDSTFVTTIGTIHENHYGGGFTNAVWNGSISLVRFGLSLPSVDQIKKIYNDEKALFQENSKATLYGTSSAVTALAYDDSTRLLYAGTSSGRSDFQGLERINNTTTAVTTAISASNGLVAEQ